MTQIKHSGRLEVQYLLIHALLFPFCLIYEANACVSMIERR